MKAIKKGHKAPFVFHAAQNLRSLWPRRKKVAHPTPTILEALSRIHRHVEHESCFGPVGFAQVAVQTIRYHRNSPEVYGVNPVIPLRRGSIFVNSEGTV